jgi:uncharacterized membrane protein YjjP (DUF1212 family)
MNSILVVEPKGRAVRREQEFDMEEAIQTRLTRVESDVKHVIEIVTDVKVELRRTNDKLDGLKEEMASMKVWAIGLYVALAASLLFVMAKGFHWL